MKIIKYGDGRVVKLIKKSDSCYDGDIRLSCFVFPYRTEKAVLLKNTLTKQVILLTLEEWKMLCDGSLRNDIKSELFRLCFIVNSESEDINNYYTSLSVLRIMQAKRNGIESYTILPTTGCNARCFYCYEESWKTKTMTPDIADAVSDFILRTRQEEMIRLYWFGGEPLCGSAAISRICSNLKDHGVEYYSTIITNATLFTPDLVKHAVAHWNLKRVQVSMDGAKIDYEQRKNYIQPQIHNYESAIHAIELLSDAGVKVSVRCNYDKDNLSRIIIFFKDCKERFKNRNNISFYLEQLFQYENEEESAALFKASRNTSMLLDELNLASTERLEQQLKIHYCMADSQGKSVIVDPSGGLHLCEHDVQGKPFGTVFDSYPVWPAVEEFLSDECRSCCFLPNCTPFRKGSCPLKIAACKTQMEVRTERSLSIVLSDYLKNSKDISEMDFS